MALVPVRKKRAGMTSHGHVWHHDGDVLEIPEEHARELLAIGDGGFELAPEDARTELDEAPPAQRRRGRPRAGDGEISE